MMIASVETVQSQAYDGVRFKMLKPVIEKLCQLCGIEVDFVPYGLAGDVIHGAIKCHLCGLISLVRLSLCNEVTVHCRYCMHEHRVFTNGKTAYTIVTLPVTESKMTKEMLILWQRIIGASARQGIQIESVAMLETILEWIDEITEGQ